MLMIWVVSTTEAKAKEYKNTTYYQLLSPIKNTPVESPAGT
jgi:hypothetical protein